MNMPKFQTRDVIALASLALATLTLLLEAFGRPAPDWLRPPLATIVTVVLGYYFVDSARKDGKGDPS
jgi:hypothetical protein